MLHVVIDLKLCGVDFLAYPGKCNAISGLGFGKSIEHPSSFSVLKLLKIKSRLFALFFQNIISTSGVG